MDSASLLDLARVLLYGTILLLVCFVFIYGAVLLDRYERRLEDSATSGGEEVVDQHEAIKV